MNSILRYIASCGIGCVAAISLNSCSDNNKWTVKGSVNGAEGNTLTLEASSNGRWYPMDSVKLSDSGKFSFSNPAAGYPDIYRLRLNGKTIYFPIDSIETISITSTADAFDSDNNMTGSKSAEMLMYVDRKIADVAKSKGVQNVSSDSLLKRELSGMLLGNPSGIISYYIINKKIGGVPVFNPENKTDLRVIGAIANAFDINRPNDPRTPYLKALFLGNRTVRNGSAGATDTIVATEVPFFEIDLYDNTGKQQLLTDAAEKNKVVILNFTVYSHEDSPAFNIELNKLYERYHNSGLEIYQVSLDADEYLWKQTAKNLPWITVYNSQTDGNTNLTNYNIVNLPTTYIISNGEIKDRVTDLTTLSSKIAKHL